MTSSKILFYFCLSFIGGIFLSSFFLIPQLFVLGFLILGLTLISLFWKYKKLAIFGFCILFFVLGIFRHQQVLLKIENNELRKFKDLNEKITLVGIISKEPDIREKSQKLTIEIQKIIRGDEIHPIEGKILVTTRKYPQYQYGDKLKIFGKLKEPQTFEGFNYKNYLLKDGIFSVMDFPKIEKIGENFGNPVMKTIFSFKNKLKGSLNANLSLPHSGFLEALLFGEEKQIPDDWKEKLNFTGTRHIAAVSGMNITIISGLILNFLLLFGFWRGQAFYFSVILIFLYVLMIGAPTSGIRAAIMGFLFLTAQHFGRLSNSSRAIIFAASLMLLLNPLLLKLDVGFQLSFLATLGLIYLTPIFLEIFQKIPNSFQIRNNIATTLGAQAFVLPILIYNFGQFSLVSPLANILILPLLPPITILGFVFSFFGIFFQPLGYLLSFPTWLFLTYILKIIDFSSKIPFAALIFKEVPWFFLPISYLILGIITWQLNKKFAPPSFLR